MSLGNKEIMSKNIQYYMHKKGVDRNKIVSDLGVKYTTLTDWINGVTYPRIDKIELLANYFGIEKSDLVEEHKFIPLNDYAIDIENIPETVMLFDGKPLTDKDKIAIKNLIEIYLGGNKDD